MGTAMPSNVEKKADIPKQWLQEHRRSLRFSDDLCRMAKQRRSVFAQLKRQHHETTQLLRLATSDLQAFLPLLDAELERNYDELFIWTKRALDAGDETAAAAGARALAHGKTQKPGDED